MSSSAKPQVIIKIKRKVSHGGGHHGGAWKVAYADFITCMFALFMVLWLLTQADLQLRTDIARYFRNSSVLPGGSMIGSQTSQARTDKAHVLDASITVVQGSGEELEALRGRAKEIQKQLEQNPKLNEIRDNVRVKVTDEGLEIQIIDSGAAGRKDLLFEVNSAALSAPLQALLSELATQLGMLPNRIEIGGHTDARPFAAGSQQSNWDLSFARANAARQVMEMHGLYPHQVLGVTAYADSKLLNSEDPLADENRRLSVLARREDQPKTKGKAAAADPSSRLPPPIVVPGVPPLS
ncbi:MAG TPA: flagellar motor protein MotB [Candidatus Binatia bacterium]|jgi:chemotaxis protein MotB